SSSRGGHPPSSYLPRSGSSYETPRTSGSYSQDYRSAYDARRAVATRSYPPMNGTGIYETHGSGYYPTHAHGRPATAVVERSPFSSEGGVPRQGMFPLEGDYQGSSSRRRRGNLPKETT